MRRGIVRGEDGLAAAPSATIAIMKAALYPNELARSPAENELAPTNTSQNALRTLTEDPRSRSCARRSIVDAIDAQGTE
jgi:hypothetical protein